MSLIKEIKEKKIFLISICVIIIIFLLIGIVVYFMTKSETKPKTNAVTPCSFHENSIVTSTERIGPFHHSILLKTDNLRVFRLPKNLEPVEYDLRIQTFLGNISKITDRRNKFDGEVLIKIRVLETTKIITLNSEDIQIRNITIDHLEYLHVHQNYIEIVLLKDLEKNSEIEIFIEYSGNIRNDSKGFYDTSYLDEQGNRKITLVTQMEPDYARLVVPCFDEPEYKAIWKLRVIHPEGTQAISNADLDETNDTIPGQKISIFQDSPKMSSYLLAFFISDFTYLEKNTTSDIRVRVWSRPEETANLKLALETAIKVLDKFETDFGIPYSLGKLDMIEVKEFRSGANWGLIICKEGKLSYNEKMDSLENKRNIQTVIAHEIAHQWFGNLVTMKNWNQVWLNEGFATLYELYGADIANNGAYKWETQFLINSQKKAFDFESDSLFKNPEKIKNHPMTFELKENDNIRDYFNKITYKKAGSILFMIRKLLGAAVFNDAIRNYLNSSQYENVNEDDLYAYFQTFHEKNNAAYFQYASFAKSFSENMMFPVVRVEHFNESHLQIEQLNMTYDKDTKEISLVQMADNNWEIPIYYRKNLEENTTLSWLQTTPRIIEASSIVLNIDSDCYYRVDYNESIWDQIAQQLNKDHTVYSVKTRFRLLEDAIFFGKDLEIDDYLRSETEKLPRLAYLKMGRQSNIDIMLLRKSWFFVKENYLKDDKIDEVEITHEMIEIQCQYTNCLSYAQTYIDQMKKCEPNVQISKCSEVPAQLRKLVYCIGKAYDEEFRNLVEEWKKVERRASEIKYFDAIKHCEPKNSKFIEESDLEKEANSETDDIF